MLQTRRLLQSNIALQPLQIAGWEKACELNPDLNKGLSIVKGKVVYEAIS